jgi:hypothetical protein
LEPQYKINTFEFDFTVLDILRLHNKCEFQESRKNQKPQTNNNNNRKQFTCFFFEFLQRKKEHIFYVRNYFFEKKFN